MVATNFTTKAIVLCIGYCIFVMGLYAWGIREGINHWNQLIILYSILPAVYFLTIRKFGMDFLRAFPPTKSHPRVVENNIRFNDLFQRIVRATYAAFIAVMGTKEVIAGWNSDIWRYTSEGCEFYMYGLCLFYAYDTYVLLSFDFLGLSAKVDVAMYLHHLSLIFAYAVSFNTKSMAYFAAHLMIMELLVPFGVMLHWVKVLDITGYFPLSISIGGFLVITAVRVPIIAKMLFEFFNNWNHPSFALISLVARITFFLGCVTCVYLEYVWGSLYVDNIRRNLKEMKQRED